MDEPFTGISDEFIPAFYEFTNKLCNSLGIDMLIVSHDVRVPEEFIDNIYLMENGVTKKIK